jgi:hypothetical protein
VRPQAQWTWLVCGHLGPCTAGCGQSQRQVHEPRGWWQTGHSTVRQRSCFLPTLARTIKKLAITAVTTTTAGFVERDVTLKSVPDDPS